jgi:hypothetical protein
LHEELNLVTGLCEAGLEDAPFVAEPLLGTAQRPAAGREVSAAAGRQLDPLQVLPDPLGRVEVRRLARELLEVEALGGSTAPEVVARLAARTGRAVPEDKELPADLAQHDPPDPHNVFQDPHNVFGVVGALLGLQEEASLGRDPTDGGKRVAGERHSADGRLPARRPRPHGAHVRTAPTSARRPRPHGAHVRTASGSREKPD